MVVRVDERKERTGIIKRGRRGSGGWFLYFLII
jgi:hypothetical protein